eukprot:TRINITY_DN15410_c0_g1_i1.p2 TRINITY_DN15410_c0_g1~~TRINITY_DN15410_c0_g1_i1.p2  ORF type:complete len:67 (-),score=9.61 TRINITY_DN15410_c0_g1_i1:90-290(-)
MDVIKEVLQDTVDDLQLYVAPPRTALQPENTFESMGLVPAAIVNVSIGGKQVSEILRSGVLENIEF